MRIPLPRSLSRFEDIACEAGVKHKGRKPEVRIQGAVEPVKTGDSVNNFQTFARYRGLLTWMRWVPGAQAYAYVSQAKNLEAKL